MCTNSLQSCLTLCDPTDCSPPGSSVHGDSLGKNTGEDCHALSSRGSPQPRNWTHALFRLLHLQADSLPLNHLGSPDSIFKSKDITLLTKVRLVKAMVFPVVMYECESWTMKKAEHGRIDAFEVWCWRRLLRVPWTAGRSSQSILKEISPGISLEGMMLKLKLQYFGHLVWSVDSLEKTLMLGGIGGRRRRGRPRMRWLDVITDWKDVSLSELRVLVMDREAWHAVIHGVAKSRTRLSDWTELIYRSLVSFGRYIPKYFILFVAMVNAIVSLISLSIFSLLVYRNAIS